MRTFCLWQKNTSGDKVPKKNFKFKYDFEIGYFVKSPCKKCVLKKTLPKCADRCDLLDKIHTVLSEAVSCTRRNY
jgi:hypothetical protein